MDVTIIIPEYNPNEEILNKIRRALKEQIFEDKVFLIEVNKGLGLAESLNYGIKKAKTKIVVSLHQDCIPASKDWLKRLVNPLKNKEFVASVSKVELPMEFWRNFGCAARAMSSKEQGILTPLMDEKGCAYKKEAIEKVGYFDSNKFRTSGEDYDMWLKLCEIGKIFYPDCRILHYHKHTFIKRIKKELQLSNGFGALVRIYRKRVPKWYLGFLKSTPVLGFFIFLLNIDYKKSGFCSLTWIPTALIINFIYCFGFWKGFFKGKETI